MEMKKILTLVVLCGMLAGCANQASNNTTQSNDQVAESSSAIDEADEVTGEDKYEYQYFYEQYNKPFKVSGGIGIEQFISALGIEGEYGWSTDPTFDKINGYFEYSEEGDGAYRLKASYWNRTDGKKMFILCFNISEWAEASACAGVERVTDWYEVRVGHPNPESKESCVIRESGVVAYLYNAETETLEPMMARPFNNIPATSDMMSFCPPQKGKDIEICQYGVDEFEESEYHTLKFNGQTFDYVK